jgi:hypothetical protein
MNVRGIEFFIWLIRHGFEEITSQRFPDLYIDLLRNEYCPSKHVRLFQRKDVQVFFDLFTCTIGNDARLLGSFIFATPWFGEDGVGTIEFVEVPPYVFSVLINEKITSARYIPVLVKRHVFDRDKGLCQHCGSSDQIEYDHIRPFSKGGPSTISNLQLLCMPCNRRKRNKF